MNIRLRYFDYSDKEYTYHDQLDMPCAWYAVENGKGEFELSTGQYDSTKWEDLSENERAKWTLIGNMPSEWKGREIYEGDILHTNEADWVAKVIWNYDGFMLTGLNNTGFSCSPDYDKCAIIGTVREGIKTVEPRI